MDGIYEWWLYKIVEDILNMRNKLENIRIGNKK
jgi:hypothetical protein